MNKGSLLFLLLAVNSNIVFTMQASPDSIVRPQAIRPGDSAQPQSELVLPGDPNGSINFKSGIAAIAFYQPDENQIRPVPLKRCSPEIN